MIPLNELEFTYTRKLSSNFLLIASKRLFSSYVKKMGFFSALASQLNVGLENNGWQWCFFLCTKHYGDKKIPSTFVD